MSRKPLSNSNHSLSTLDLSSSLTDTEDHIYMPDPESPVQFIIDKIQTKHKSHFLSKDKQIITQVVQSSMNGVSSPYMNTVLRRHFTELGERFLQPLNRYFEELIHGNPAEM
jgi:hypothetical protein